MLLAVKIKINLVFNFPGKIEIIMPVLHHKVNILKITDKGTRLQLEHSAKVQKAVIMKLDDNHWLIDNSMIDVIEKECQKGSASLKQSFEFA